MSLNEPSKSYLQRLIKHHRKDSVTFSLSKEKHLDIANKLKYGKFSTYIDYRKYCTQNNVTFYGRKPFYDYKLSFDTDIQCG